MSTGTKLQDLQDLYKPQLKEFTKDDSYFKDYKDCKVKDNYLLVRVFTVKQEKKSQLIGVDSRTGEYTTEGIRIPTTVCKVIKSGVDYIKSGDLVYMPYDEVAGVKENPKMKAYLQSLATKGATPIKPLDSREFIGALEISHKRKMVVQKGHIQPQGEDFYTYVFGAGEIQMYQNL